MGGREEGPGQSGGETGSAEESDAGGGHTGPEACCLGLPFTHNRRWTKSLISQRKPEAHELKCGVALPDQLMTGRWVVVASEISADLRDQAYRFTQQHGWLQAFFLRRRATSAIRHRRTTPRQAGSASRGPAASSA